MGLEMERFITKDSNEEQVKRYAKKLKKELSITHTQALDRAAQEIGFSNYQNFLNRRKANDSLSCLQDSCKI